MNGQWCMENSSFSCSTPISEMTLPSTFNSLLILLLILKQIFLLYFCRKCYYLKRKKIQEIGKRKNGPNSKTKKGNCTLCCIQPSDTSFFTLYSLHCFHSPRHPNAPIGHDSHAPMIIDFRSHK